MRARVCSSCVIFLAFTMLADLVPGLAGGVSSYVIVIRYAHDYSLTNSIITFDTPSRFLIFAVFTMRT